MAIVKMKWFKNSQSLGKYLEKERDGESLTTGSMGLDNLMYEAIEDELERHNDKSPNQGIHIVQSWSANESKLFSISKYNEMGRELADKVAPGHLHWVTTHTEKDHVHNHIVICAVHSITGGRIKNKKSLVFKLRDFNDELARANGLEVIARPVRGTKGHLTEKVNTIVMHGQYSWKFDLLHKADFARSLSQSFDEYVSVLSPLGVQARVENKNITYFIDGRKKGVRGNKLGKRFDKDGLIEAFKENSQKFESQPELKGKLQESATSKFKNDGQRQYPVTIQPSKTSEGIGRFTKTNRDQSLKDIAESSKKFGTLLTEEIHRASQNSILEYCKKNKIRTINDKDGKTRLEGRESIVITDHEWTNTRNNLKGSIIQFAMNHHRFEYLDALALLNNNPNLLLLKSVQGEHRKNFHAFYVPRMDKSNPVANGHLGKLLEHFGHKGQSAIDQAMPHKGLEISTHGSVFLSNQERASGIEYIPKSHNLWAVERYGKSNDSFFQTVGKGSSLTVFFNPFDFIVANRGNRLTTNKNMNILVGFDEILKDPILQFLGMNPHIKKIQFFDSGHLGQNPDFLALTKNLKPILDPFKIEMERTDGKNLSKERGLGLDF